MALAYKYDRETSGKSRTQADLSRTWIEGCFPAARSTREPRTIQNNKLLSGIEAVRQDVQTAGA
jgi:hypothetical protein